MAQRLGLIPLNVDPALMEYRTTSGFHAQPNDRNTLVFRYESPSLTHLTVGLLIRRQSASRMFAKPESCERHAW